MCCHCQTISLFQSEGTSRSCWSSQYGSESVNRLANPHAMTSVNIENGFEENEENENAFFIIKWENILVIAT